MATKFRGVLLGILVIFSVAVGGCGSNDGKLNARGRLMKGGAPLATGDADDLRVIFYALTPDGTTGKNSYLAAVDGKDGTFKVIGGDGKGLPPGKYRVCVENLGKKKGLVSSVHNSDVSPFVFEIDWHTKEIVIDLDKTS
jgi:hypothetical protein